MNQADPRERFTHRVTHYQAARPDYPAELLEALRTRLGWSDGTVIAEFGSGTGILTRRLLDIGCAVFAVEPNASMRSIAERDLSGNARFRSVPGSAEDSTLPAQSVDGIIAAQAFHWFQGRRAHQEFARILKPGGWLAVVWNERCAEGAPLRQDYEHLLETYGTDYHQVRQRTHRSQAFLDQLFTPASRQAQVFANHQLLDHDGLHARLLSSSYLPQAGSDAANAMLAAADRLFDQYSQDGLIRIEYDTALHAGQLSEPEA